MNKTTHDDILAEIEYLNGMCIKGDPTLIVFKMLTKTKDVEGLYEHFGIETKSTMANNEPTQIAPSFNDLFATGVKLE